MRGLATNRHDALGSIGDLLFLCNSLYAELERIGWEHPMPKLGSEDISEYIKEREKQEAAQRRAGLEPELRKLYETVEELEKHLCFFILQFAETVFTTDERTQHNLEMNDGNN